MASDQCDTNVILLRRLLPRLLYPGRRRVGLKRASMEYRADVSVFDGIDWWWGTSLLRALRFLRSRRSKVLLLEWWTAATLHTYLVLAMAARLTGMRVVIELHELQDPGEAGLALARGYGRWGLRALIRLAHGCIVHSKSDWQLFESNYGPMDMRVALVPHGPYDQYRDVQETSDPAITAAISAVRTAPKSDGVVNLLFFGLIRPYKGLEDLLRVFNALPREEAERLWLTVVGETWEGCTGAGASHRRQPARGPHHVRQRVRARRGRRRGLRARRRGRASLPALVKQRHPARRDELGPAHRGDQRRRPARGRERLRGRGVRAAGRPGLLKEGL